MYDVSVRPTECMFVFMYVRMTVLALATRLREGTPGWSNNSLTTGAVPGLSL